MKSGVAHLLLIDVFFAGSLITLGFNAPSWTVSVEAFFYAVFPLIRRRGALAAALAGLALFVVLFRTARPWLEAIYPSIFTFFPPLQLWIFAAGLALAQLWTPRRLPFGIATALEVAALALLAIAVMHNNPFGGDGYAIALAGAALLVIAAFACQSGALSRILLLPPLVLLGEASYGLYLWHHMLMISARDLLPAAIAPGASQVLAAAAVILPIIALSIATYLWFEVPLRRWIVPPSAGASQAAQ